jgi:hypothetical protein
VGGGGGGDKVVGAGMQQLLLLQAGAASSRYTAAGPGHELGCWQPHLPLPCHLWLRMCKSKSAGLQVLVHPLQPCNLVC